MASPSKASATIAAFPTPSANKRRRRPRFNVLPGLLGEAPRGRLVGKGFRPKGIGSRVVPRTLGRFHFGTRRFPILERALRIRSSLAPSVFAWALPGNRSIGASRLALRSEMSARRHFQIWRFPPHVLPASMILCRKVAQSRRACGFCSVAPRLAKTVYFARTPKISARRHFGPRHHVADRREFR